MSVSEQQSSQEFDNGGFGSILGHRLGSTLLNNEASIPSIQHLPLVSSPEVVNLSKLSPYGGIRGDTFAHESPSSDDGYSTHRPPLDLHTLWRLLEKMDKEARQNGGGHLTNRKTIGVSSIDGVQVPLDGDNIQPDDGLAKGGKMSTWELVVLQGIIQQLCCTCAA